MFAGKFSTGTTALKSNIAEIDLGLIRLAAAALCFAPSACALTPLLTHLDGFAKSFPDFFKASSGASVNTWSSVRVKRFFYDDNGKEKIVPGLERFIIFKKVIIKFLQLKYLFRILFLFFEESEIHFP